MPANGHVRYDEPDIAQPVPQAPDAEEAVCGSLIKDERVMHLLDGVLRPSAFITPRFRDIYQAATNLYRDGSAIDPHTLRLELERMGSPFGLLELAEVNINTPSSAHAQHYAGIVNEMDNRRQVISAGQTAAELAWSLSVKIDAVNARAKATMDGATLRKLGTPDGGSAGVYMRSYLDARQSEERLELGGAGTPWKLLDRMTLGLRPGYVYYQAARPQVGKSVLIHQLALHFVQNHGPIYLATLEMGWPSIVERMLAMVTGLPRHRMQLNNLDPRERELMHTAGRQLMPLLNDRVRYCTAGVTVEQITANVTRAQAELGPLSLVLIDYLQLVGTEYRQGNREQDVAHVSQQVKTMAERTGVPVWAAVQVTREAAKRGDGPPELHDLRESGSLEQDADYVLALHRDGPNVTKPKYHGEALLVVLKDRHYGKAGVDGRLRWQIMGERYSDPEARYDDVPFDAPEEPD